MAAQVSNTSAVTMCDAAVDAFDVGTTDATGDLIFYSGSVPADADAALGGATVLAQLTLSNPAFGSAVDVSPGARATANSITSDTSADATGTCTFFRARNRDNVSKLQGTVTATGGGGDMEVNTTSFVTGATVQVTSWTITMPE